MLIYGIFTLTRAYAYDIIQETLCTAYKSTVQTEQTVTLKQPVIHPITNRMFGLSKNLLLWSRVTKVTVEIHPRDSSCYY